MTFAALRQTVIQSHALGEDRFAEDVEIGTRSVRAKITHDSLTSRGKGEPRNTGTRSVEEAERVQVLVSRDPAQGNSLPVRPQPGDTLRRSADRDPDTRPFQFKGEVIFEGDQHAVYIFERLRRTSQAVRS